MDAIQNAAIDEIQNAVPDDRGAAKTLYFLAWFADQAPMPEARARAVFARLRALPGSYLSYPLGTWQIFEATAEHWPPEHRMNALWDFACLAARGAAPGPLPDPVVQHGLSTPRWVVELTRQVLADQLPDLARYRELPYPRSMRVEPLPPPAQPQGAELPLLVWVPAVRREDLRRAREAAEAAEREADRRPLSLG